MGNESEGRENDKHVLSVPPSSNGMVCSPRSIAKPFVFCSMERLRALMERRRSCRCRYQISYVDQRMELIKFYMVERQVVFQNVYIHASSLGLGNLCIFGFRAFHAKPIEFSLLILSSINVVQSPVWCFL